MLFSALLKNGQANIKKARSLMNMVKEWMRRMLEAMAEGSSRAQALHDVAFPGALFGITPIAY